MKGESGLDKWMSKMMEMGWAQRDGGLVLGDVRLAQSEIAYFMTRRWTPGAEEAKGVIRSLETLGVLFLGRDRR